MTVTTAWVPDTTPMVLGTGLEPVTYGFSVRHSTN